MGVKLETLLNSGIALRNERTGLFPVEERLADRMRTARKRQGWSQHTLATRASTTQTAIANIESGKSLRPRNIVALAEALKVKPSWLMFGVSQSESDLSAEAIVLAKAWSRLPESERGIVRDSLMYFSKGKGEHNESSRG